MTEVNGTHGLAVEATWGDAFKEMSFFAGRELSVADVRSHKPATGVTLEGAPKVGGKGKAIPRVGDGFNFTLDGTKVVNGVKVRGTLSLKIYCEADGGIVWKHYVVPAGLWFDLGCGVEQRAGFEVTAGPGASDGRMLIDEVTLDTLYFMVGPVPVVIDFDLGIYVDINGNVTTSLKVGASEWFNANASIHYRTGKGWWTGYGRDSGTESHGLDFRTELKGLGVSFAFRGMLYKIVGPQVDLSIMLEQTRTPTLDDPRECMGAVIGLGVGIHLDVGFWEGTWGPKEILSESLDFSCRTLTPPSFEMLSPPDGAKVAAGGLALTLRAKAWDESGPLRITWKINGEVLKVVASDEPILWTPAKPGDYTIDARAGNGAGEGFAVRHVSVVAPLLEVALGAFTDSHGTTLAPQQLPVGRWAQVQASVRSGIVGKPAGCAQVTWSGTGGDVDGEGCLGRIRPSGAGPVTITATAADPYRSVEAVATGTAVVVASPPATPLDFQISAATSQGQVAPGQQLVGRTTVFVTMRLVEAAPGQLPLYSWSYTTNHGRSGTLPGTDEQPGESTRSFSTKAETVTFTCRVTEAHSGKDVGSWSITVAWDDELR